MTASERDTYSKYRMEKSEEAYEVADLLVANEKVECGGQPVVLRRLLCRQWASG
jgi:hypothetical protein